MLGRYTSIRRYQPLNRKGKEETTSAEAKGRKGSKGTKRSAKRRAGNRSFEDASANALFRA